MKPVDLGVRADAMRALGALLRLGYPPRAALAEWLHHGPREMHTPLEVVKRLVRMGMPTPVVIARLEGALEQDAFVLGSLLGISERLGGNSAAMIDGLASSIENRRASLSAARASGSGAKLSGRLIAGLPLAFLPLTPISRGDLFDGMGILMLVLGIGLAAAGMMWIARLMPQPATHDDPAAALADLLAAGLRGGAGLTAALNHIADVPPPTLEELGRARRMTRLGLSWPEALCRLEVSALPALGATLARAQRLGLPVADSLLTFASEQRAEHDRVFETKNKRAMVLMMIPLAICILPAFILLAIAPFLRSLSIL